MAIGKHGVDTSRDEADRRVERAPTNLIYQEYSGCSEQAVKNIDDVVPVAEYGIKPRPQHGWQRRTIRCQVILIGHIGTHSAITIPLRSTFQA